MNGNWAEENLKTIRSLMEQARLYRRAMAPLALMVGTLGVVAAGLAQLLGWVGPEYFAGYWLGVGASVFVIFIYYIMIKSGQTMGYKGIMNPFLSVWSANIVFFLSGIFIWNFCLDFFYLELFLFRVFIYLEFFSIGVWSWEGRPGSSVRLSDLS